MILRVEGLSAGYGELQILDGVDLTVGQGEWVALLGSVGAGKSTLMGAIAGSLPALKGRIELAGAEATRIPAYDRVRRGLSLVAEGRRLFRGMTVAENLLAGAFTVRGRNLIDERVARVYELFPVLRERRKQQVGTLSGGEQQMCAIGRSLMSGPRLLLVDELSLGLAPVVVEGLLEALVTIRAEGTSLLVVEQDVETSLEYADRGYVLRQGRIVGSGPSASLLADESLQREYLGV